MNRKVLSIAATCVSAALSILLAGCSATAKTNEELKKIEAEEAPPPLQVVTARDPDLFRVDHPEQFPW